MSIYTIGLNHKCAPLAVREKVAVTQNSLSAALFSLNSLSSVEENLILSTCNRTEIYIGGRNEDCIREVRSFLAEYYELSEDLLSHFYCYRGQQAIVHLLSVVASLDSMVIGENQILNQVKEAYLRARDCEVVGRTLTLLFEEALKIGKKVRTETAIGKGAVSVSTSAIELARKKMASLDNKRVLIVGAGRIGELMVKNLARRGVSSVCVANRTYAKALSLAEEFGGKVVKFDRLREILAETDIVISSTSAPHCLIKKEDVVQAMKNRNSPLFLIDLGVPRNIEKNISGMENVFLYNIDDLETVCEQNLARRWSEVKKAEEIIFAAAEKFYQKVNLVECQKEK